MLYPESMLGLVFLSNFILYGFLDFAAANESSYCEGIGWEVFNDEKCFKLIKKWATRDDAVSMCKDETLPSDAYSPVLIQIKSTEELEYLTNFIFQTSNVKSNVWIGAKRLPGSFDQFEWDDGTGLNFANWATDFPTSQITRDCVEMQSAFTKLEAKNFNDSTISRVGSNSEGKWRDVTCETGNFVVCEKLPRWSPGKLQQTLLESRKLIHENQNKISSTKSQLSNTQAELATTKVVLENTQGQLSITQSQLSSTQGQLSITQADLANTKTLLENTQGQLASTQSQLANAQNQVENLRNNPVPVGFIYIQFANQPEPKTIWPTVSWSEVSSQYSGLFFRAEGGESASFGSTQEGTSPRLSTLHNVWYDSSVSSLGTFQVTPGQWTPYLRTGGGGNREHHGVRFLVSSSEVRPRNQAVRIWRRSN